MRKTFAVLLATAFVATLPSLASAKSKRHKREYEPVVQQVDTNVAGPRLVGNALYQFIVPLQVTFGPRPAEPVVVAPPRKRHHVKQS